ncbi:MAG: sulfurtransferase complex subunit TusB [Candidatus Hodarchaeota archaeon]
MNSIVYLYGFSPNSNDKLETLIEILKEQTSLDLEINIVLIQDGVIGTSRKGITPESIKTLLNLPVNVCAIIPDIKARGMDPNNLINQVKAIEYEDLVDILVETQKIVSWM